MQNSHQNCLFNTEGPQGAPLWRLEWSRECPGARSVSPNEDAQVPQIQAAPQTPIFSPQLQLPLPCGVPKGLSHAEA